MPDQRLKVLIWGKTYPELSKAHTETVCTGACREDGAPIRLYPVPLRYLEEDQQYTLYHWIDIPVARNPKDPRPESYRVESGEIKLLEKLPPDREGWHRRREVIFRDPSWHYFNLGRLKEEQRATLKSIGLVTPGEIVDVRKVERSAQDREEYNEKMKAIQGQQDIFRTEYRELEFLPYDVRLRWRCAELCPECSRSPHDMKVLDWGLMQLGRKEGWNAAVDRLVKISDLRTYEFRLFMGNMFRHQHTFTILGFWYPKISEQRSLFA